MAAAGPFVLYNDFKLNHNKGLLDLSGDSFSLILVASTSNAIAASMSPATYAAVTDELATANGYTAGGYSVGVGSLTGGGGTASITFDVANATWTASGAGIVFRAGVLRDVTSGYLIGYFLGDSTPADVTVAAGVPLTVQIANVFVET